jgi:GTP cyclohydrolase IA
MAQDPLIESVKHLLASVGEDPAREGLVRTPQRYIRALQYLTKGYKESVPDIINGAIFETEYQDMVIVKNIEIYSMCEHHLLPFYGKCHVAYLPKGKIIGLSKIGRIVDIFARRLQVQERLTHQIAESLMEHLHPLGVGVVMEAFHLCMMMRGIEKQNAVAKTSSLLGAFRRPEVRLEFFNLIN